MQFLIKHKGEFIAVAIIILWFACLAFALQLPVDYRDPYLYVLILLQTHLYTGLFITAHDAMHWVVSVHKKVNKTLGTVSALLFAYNHYPRLFSRHHAHHRHVATEKDPDFHNGTFFSWYFSFLKQYITLWQILFMALTFNLLILFFPQSNVILFWIIPSILSTLQLFYFGTYLPHKGEHAPENQHKSRSFMKNHWLAFFTCYFFGYHYEHHHAPRVPWWQLYKEKEKQL